MKDKRLKFMQNNVVLLQIISQCFYPKFKSKMCKLSRLMFHLLQFLLFYFLFFFGQASIAHGDQKVSGISTKVS